MKINENELQAEAEKICDEILSMMSKFKNNLSNGENKFNYDELRHVLLIREIAKLRLEINELKSYNESNELDEE